MTRTASKFTQEIWKLCEKNPDITHSQAQPLLKAKGIEVVERPDMSDELRDFRDKGRELEMEEKGDFIGCVLRDDEYHYDKDRFEKIKTALDLSKKEGDEVLKEIMVRVAHAAESNYFNVVKWNWQKDKGGSKTKSKNKSKEVTATKTKKSGRKSKASVLVETEFTAATALDHVDSLGGVKETKSRISDIESEIADLQKQVEDLQAEKQNHEAAIEVIDELKKAIKNAA